MDLNKIKADLQFLQEYEVVIYGSFVSGGFGPHSDIDIAIITRSEDKETHRRILRHALSEAPPQYDIHIFESLPIVVMSTIFEDYVVLFGDPPEIGFYFYYFRKLWGDFKHRLEIPTLEEIEQGPEKLKRCLEALK